MAVDQLRLVVGADVGGAVKGFTDLNKAVAQSSAEVGKASMTWTEFVKGKMGPYMKEFGSHGAAIKKIGEEWKVYKDSLDKTGSSAAKAAGGISQVASSLNNLSNSGAEGAMARISAKIEEIAQNAQESKVKLVDLGNARLPLQSINAYNAAVLKLKANVSSIKLSPVDGFGRGVGDGINDTVKGLGKIPQASNRAGQSLNDFSRIVQDLPYGMLGITNNINPMLESFQRLKKETGSTSLALKSMAAGLVGAGGLGVVLGIVTAALTFAQIGFSMWSRGIGNAKKATDEAVKANEEYEKSVQSAFAEVAQEAAKVEVLVKTLQKEKLSKDQRIEAVKQLQQIAPAYFNTLDAENLSIQNLTASYNRYTASLKTAAEGKVLEKQLEGVIEKRLELEKILNEGGGNIARQSAQFIIDPKTGKRVQNIILETYQTEKARTANQSEYNKLKEAEENIANRLAQIKPPELVTPVKTNVDKDKVEKEIKAQIETIREIPLIPPDLFFSRTPELKNAYQASRDFEAFVKDKFETKQIPVRTNIVSEGTTFDFDKFNEDIDLLSGKLQDNLNEAFKGIQISGFASLGESIGNAIATGANPIEAAGKSIIGSIGDLISQMGKALIEYGVIKTGLDKIIQGGIAIPGATAIALGVAAVAMGALIKSLASVKPKKFAQGGFVPGSGSGDTVPAMLTPGEYVVRKKDVPLFMSIIKMLEGNKIGSPIKNIKGALGFAEGGFVPNVRSVSTPQTSRDIGNITMPAAQVILVNQRLRGRDLILQQARETASQRRTR